MAVNFSAPADWVGYLFHGFGIHDIARRSKWEGHLMLWTLFVTRHSHLKGG